MVLLNETQGYVGNSRRESLSRKTDDTPGCFGWSHAQHDRLADAQLRVSSSKGIVHYDCIGVAGNEVSAFDDLEIQQASLRRQCYDAEPVNLRTAAAM